MMNIIKHSTLLFTFLTLFVNVFAEVPMKRPKIFTEPENSYKWAEVAKTHKWGSLSTSAWLVYADRDDVRVYADPSFSVPVNHRNLSFLEPVYISETNGDFARVWGALNRDGELKKEIGWVEISKLILWETCPRTQSQVYEKALILTNLSKKNRNKGSIQAKPILSNTPNDTRSNGSAIHELEFFFVYKYEDGNALLLKTSELKNGLLSAKGWVSRGKFTNWNSRVCYEPNPSKRLINQYAVVFGEAKQADRFFRDGMFDPADTIRYDYVWFDQLKGKRWDLDIPRLPILREDNNASAYSVDRVGTIARLSESVGDNAGAYGEALKKLHALQNRMQQINIVIVMDGTMSMQRYYAQMCNAIREAMQDPKLSQLKPNFGAVVYRNEVDGPAKYKQLTHKYNDVATWLENTKCETKASASEHYESMFEGIRCAVENMAWDKNNANFMILVGDAASKKPDKYGLSEMKVGTLLASKDVNLIAFQANHYNHEAYDDFRQQITDIMYAELGSVLNRTLSVNDFINQPNRQAYRQNLQDEVVMKSAYISAAISQKGSGASLQTLVVDNISKFRLLMEERIRSNNEALENLKEGSPTGGVLNKKILQHSGLSEDEINALTSRVFNTNGYTKNFANGKEILVSAVFLTDQELNQMLIPSLKQVANISENPRYELQVALEMLAKTFLGEVDESISVNELMRKVLDLPEVVSVFPEEIVIRDLSDPAIVSDAQISDYINQIIRDVRHLEQISTESSFVKDNSTYYYILVKDMPMQNN